jgi:hypothetical protein
VKKWRKEYKRSLRKKSQLILKKKDLKNQEDLSTTESDTIKLWDYGDSEFLMHRDKILQNIFPGSVPGISMLDDS